MLWRKPGADPDTVVLRWPLDRLHPVHLKRSLQSEGEKGAWQRLNQMQRRDRATEYAALVASTQHECVLLMGTDAPALNADLLRTGHLRVPRGPSGPGSAPHNGANAGC
jgi:hypothetical protein